MFELKRRSFIAGFSSLFAAPAIVKAENIMKIFQPSLPISKMIGRLGGQWLVCNGAAVSKTEFSDLFSIFGYRYSDRKFGDKFLLPDFRKEIMMGRLPVEHQNIEPIILSKNEVLSGFKDGSNTVIVGYGTQEVSQYATNIPAKATIGHIRPYVTYERPIRAMG